MAVISREELATYCRLDEESLIEQALELSEVMEKRLLRKGCVDTPATHGDFCLAVKAMTLNELDNPGGELSRGVREIINELKFAKA